ncbi:hypothetical protein AX16_010889 [Volvariella volvacea WC 439]|nr:hypothetical protein AX16_010889 [Volvariella volvacea WC 439]
MAPRKTSTAEPAEPTRRSSRISAQSGANKESGTADAAPAATTTKRSTSKTRKRPAAAAVEEGEAAGSGAGDGADENSTGESSKKKVKQSETAAEETAAPPLPQIDIGDSLPNLILKNEKDEDVQVAELASQEKGGVILFLVPKADTPGCTTQACGFRDIYPDFTSSGYQVFCLSADAPAAQNKWQTKKSLPYPLLSDRQRVLISALGAGEGGKTKRSHFIFGKDGKLLDKKIPVKPADR